MRALILVSVAVLMAGCAAQVIDSNERMVMVNAGVAPPWETTLKPHQN